MGSNQVRSRSDLRIFITGAFWITGIINIDEAVKSVSNDPTIGDMKVGDLQSIRVYKFKSKKQPILLAYEVIDATLYLYTFGSHENFYRDLKKYLQH